MTDPTRAALSQPEPAGQVPPDYIDPQHTGADRELLQAYYAACWSEGGTVDEVTLRGLRAAIAADRAQHQPVPPEPEGPTHRITPDDFRRWWRETGSASPAPSPEMLLTANAWAQYCLSRWGRPAPQPVPVSERLPGPEDCDATGRCWWFCFECPGEHSYWILAKEVYCNPTYWLPAHALPLPGEVEG